MGATPPKIRVLSVSGELVHMGFYKLKVKDDTFLSQKLTQSSCQFKVRWRQFQRSKSFTFRFDAIFLSLQSMSILNLCFNLFSLDLEDAREKDVELFELSSSCADNFYLLQRMEAILYHHGRKWTEYLTRKEDVNFFSIFQLHAKFLNWPSDGSQPLKWYNVPIQRLFHCKMNSFAPLFIHSCIHPSILSIMQRLTSSRRRRWRHWFSVPSVPSCVSSAKRQDARNQTSSGSKMDP